MLAESRWLRSQPRRPVRPYIAECEDLFGVLPKFASEEEDWRSFGYLLGCPSQSDNLSSELECEDEATKYLRKTPERSCRLAKNRPATQLANLGMVREAKRAVLDPADISLGGDAVDWTKESSPDPKSKADESEQKEEQSIATNVARRRRNSTLSEDDSQKKPKERKLSENKEIERKTSRRRTPSHSSDNGDAQQKDEKESSRPDSVREGTPDIDTSVPHCVCQTLYDETKFYLMCDTCSGWFHGDCVDVTERMAARMSSWNCNACLEESRRIKDAPQLYCICQTPYDDTKFYVGCDSCEGWFHPKCVDITQEAAEEMAEYICPSCAEQDEEGKEQGYESSNSEYSVESFESSNQLTRLDYHFLWQLLETLSEHRNSHHFRQPVDLEQHPDYLDVVSSPMDLSTISHKLEALEYHTLKQFIGDVTQMFENAKAYNPKNSAPYHCAETLQEVFESHLAEARASMRARANVDRRHISESRTLDGSLDIDTDQLITNQIDPTILDRFLQNSDGHL
ncbi:unnamed protein product [Caenorhabditis auriculariae]|uniref:Uncharacterized protein n=1 Tax=Caenorhabditis auriculariae TaxID=2777116 RepID=A0A8S1HS33_9PELO|nr:unnamed protein product [Caenorhabditis auriculariae]